jgi:fumarate hydratase subunit alpha
MRVISADKISKAVSDLCAKANFSLRKDVLECLKAAYKKEVNKKAKKFLGAVIANAYVANKERIAICQDTGLPILFLEVGQDVLIKGDLKRAVNKGVDQGYKKYSLRNSIVHDPVDRKEPGFIPALIHIDLVKGSKIKITLLAKGFGCENKSRLKMFNPTVSFSQIKQFVVEAVKDSGADACPPYVVGVGIGGTADYSGYLAKKALLKPVACTKIRKLEADLLKEINRLNIGPMGLGGKFTCLGVNIETAPTHIAGFPVSVNISCHALRSAAVEL